MKEYAGKRLFIFTAEHLVFNIIFNSELCQDFEAVEYNLPYLVKIKNSNTE